MRKAKNYSFKRQQLAVALACVLGLERALILHQVHYWCGNSSHAKDGRRWVYNTMEQWAKEFPYIPFGTLRKHIDALRKDGLLLCRNDLNKKGFDRTLWYAVSGDRLKEIGFEMTPKIIRPFAHFEQSLFSPRAKGTVTGEQKELSPQSKTIPIDYTKTTSLDYQQAQSAEKQKSANTEKPSEQQPKVTLAAILKAEDGKKNSQPVKPSSVSASSLALYWKGLVPLWHDVQFAGEFTLVDKGIIKNLNKLPDPYHVMDVVVSRWIEFGNYVKNSEKACKDFPLTPSFRFVVKHMHLAATFSAQNAPLVLKGPTVKSVANIPMSHCAITAPCDTPPPEKIDKAAHLKILMGDGT